VTLTPLKTLAILASLVAVLIAALVVAIAQIGLDDGARAWFGAALGAIGGVAVCVVIFLYSARRRHGERSRRWEWLMGAGAASAIGLSALPSTWEAAALGFLVGFLACWILWLAAVVAARTVAERPDA
jgi:hypothetical protein